MWKINVSRFPPAWTATRWNLSRRGKDLTFCTGVNSAFVCQPTWFSSQYPPQYLLYISDVQFHMASLHSSGQKYPNSSFWIFYMYFLWTECPCCTWWVEFRSPRTSDNYSKAIENKAVCLSSKPACWSCTFSSDTVDLSQCLHLKASLGSQCCSAKHKYITLHFTWAPLVGILIFSSKPQLFQQIHHELEC